MGALATKERGGSEENRERESSGGVWGRELEKRWRGKDNKRGVRTQRKTLLRPKTASCVTRRFRAWVCTELIPGQRSNGSHRLSVYI